MSVLRKITGILLCLSALLTCAQAAQTAQPAQSLSADSRQQFTLSGQPVTMHAKSCGGANYVPADTFAAAVGYTIACDTTAQTLTLTPLAEGETASTAAPALPKVSGSVTLQCTAGDRTATLSCWNENGVLYCPLRGIAKLLNVSTVYNGVTNTVEIDPAFPYFEHQGNTLILMYHMIVESPSEFSEALYGTYTTTARFRENIRDLKARGYQCISLDDYMAGKTKADQKYFIITFDDGYPSNYHLAYPILREEGATATIFDIVERSDWGCIDFLSADQMREMEASGLVRIGSHTMSHKQCATLDAETLRAQLTESRDWLDEHLGRPTLYLAYPYGSYNKQSYLAAKQAGYRAQMVQGRQFAADDLLVRMDIRYDTDIVALTRTGVHN